MLPAFADRVPYNAIVVELEEGPYVVSNLVDHDDADLVVGRAVEVMFADIDSELTLPQFRPAASSPPAGRVRTGWARLGP